MVGSNSGSAYDDLRSCFDDEAFSFWNSVMVGQVYDGIAWPYDDIIVGLFSIIVVSRIFSIASV